jgi:hypothetical protein
MAAMVESWLNVVSTDRCLLFGIYVDVFCLLITPVVMGVVVFSLCVVFVRDKKRTHKPGGEALSS